MDDNGHGGDDQVMEDVGLTSDGGSRLSRELSYCLVSYALVGTGLYLQSMGEMWAALWSQSSALVVLLVALLQPQVLPRSLPILPRQIALLIVAALGAAMVAMPPGVYTLIKTMSVYSQYLALAAGLACLAGATVAAPRVLGRATIPLLLAMVAATGVWIIRNAPEPFIDLYSHHQLSCQALLDGKNPYGMTFPDIYGPGSPYTNDAMVQNGRTTYGFAYPPLMLYAALPGYALFGDYRFGYLGCLLIGAGCMAYATRAWVATVASVLLLLAPRMFHVLESGWTEMPLFAALGVFVLLALRRSFWAISALAVVMSGKQFMIIGLPLLFLLLPQPLNGKDVIRFALAFAVPVVLLHGPWIAIDSAAYYRSTVGVHANTPFRADSVSWMSALSQNNTQPWPNSVGMLAGLAVAVAGMAVARKRPIAFLLGLAASLQAFLLLTRGFTNYFMMVLSLVCAAMAVSLVNRVEAAEPVVEDEQ